MAKNPIVNHPVILFDGVCNLCNASVQFIIERDKKRYFRFATLQGETAKRLLANHKINHKKTESVILVFGDRAFLHSRAALEITKKLNGLWPLLYVFRFIPAVLRDKIYDWIAKNRYRWFGKREACMIPSRELQELFL